MTSPNSNDLVKREDVQKALCADVGSTAKLISFGLKDFTSKGDNYSCIVSSLELAFEKDGLQQQTSYVVKLNPMRPIPMMEKMAAVCFEKEIGFYKEIVPLLNKELERLNQSPIRMPKYLYSVSKDKEEVIFLEDMRIHGYKMLDRKIGMDRNHTMLIMKELARLHAISVVLMNTEEFKRDSLEKKFPFLYEAYSKMMEGEMMNDWMGQSIATGADIVERNKGYEYAGKFLRSLVPNSMDVMINAFKANEPFFTLCHGDCWSNNFLFRYDDSGVPVECCLLDLQLNRLSSPATDLNYMMYTSMNGDVRQENFEDFFDAYYANFASILAANKQAMKFTHPMLKEEFTAKNIFGLIMGTALIPLFLMDSDDVPDLKNFKEDEIEKTMAEHKEKVMTLVQQNPLLTSRFLSMFDEMRQGGLFDSVSSLSP